MAKVNNITKVIVSDHDGFIDWLEDHEVVDTNNTPCYKYVTEKKTRYTDEMPVSDLKNKHVYGNLPYHVACCAKYISMLYVPKVLRNKKIKEMTAEELEEAGAYLSTYEVKLIEEQ